MIPFNLARKLILPFVFMWKRLDSFEGQLMGFRYFHVGSSSFLLVETLSNFILKNILNLPPKTTKTSCMLGNSTVHLINRTCTVKGIPTAIFSITVIFKCGRSISFEYSLISDCHMQQNHIFLSNLSCVWRISASGFLYFTPAIHNHNFHPR